MRQVAQTFGNTTRTGQRSMRAYWNAPGDATQSPAQMRPWAALALDSALRAAVASRAAMPRKAQARMRQPSPAPAGPAAGGEGRKTGA